MQASRGKLYSYNCNQSETPLLFETAARQEQHLMFFMNKGLDVRASGPKTT